MSVKYRYIIDWKLPSTDSPYIVNCCGSVIIMITCNWSSRSPKVPKCIGIVIGSFPQTLLVVGGEFALMRNDTPVLKRKYLQLIDSENKLHIELKYACSRSLPESSFSLKGFVVLSNFQEIYTTESPNYKDKCKQLRSLKILSRDFAQLLDPQTACVPTDVNLKCGDALIPAHKLVLSARSPVFAAMFAYPMKENLENEVEITDIDESVLRAMVEYIYTGVVSDTSAAADILIAADKYQLNSLKEVCCVNLKEKLSLINVVALLKLGDSIAKDLKTYAIQYICQCPDFFAIKNTEEWKSLETSNPGLAIEVLTTLMQSKDKMVKRFKAS